MSAHGTGSKIPPTLLPVPSTCRRACTQARAACGTTTSSRRGWKSEHGIQCSHDAVRGALLPLRQMARAATADAIRTRILERIPDQIEALDGLMDKVRALVAPKPGKKVPSAGTVLSALDEFRKGLETKPGSAAWARRSRCRPTWPSKRCRVEMPATSLAAVLRARLLQLPDPERRAALAALRPETALALLHDWRFRARDAQLAPEGPWRTWMVMAGRGFGKTRCGAEWILERVEAGARRIHLVGATAADVRDTMIEGRAGSQHRPAPPAPGLHPPKRLLRWPQNGARALCFSSEKPRQLRGPQCDTAWADETAAWEKPDTWDQLLFGLRLGSDPRVCVTTTPRPTKLIKDILRARTTVVTRGSTYENAANLADDFIADIITRFEGTRLGRQELLAEILEDTPGALWKLAPRCHARRRSAGARPHRRRRRPSATNTESSAETGIIAAGVDTRGHGVLRDASGKYSPGEWGERAVLLHDELSADAIVVETNQGGDMAVHVITTAAEKLHRAKKRATPHITVVRVHACAASARAEAPPRSTSRAGCITCGASRSSKTSSRPGTRATGRPRRIASTRSWALTWSCCSRPRRVLRCRGEGSRSVLDATSRALRTTPTKTTTDPRGNPRHPHPPRDRRARAR